MNSVKLLCYSLFAISAISMTVPTKAADSELNIPRITGEPTLQDFVGMQPNTALARSMSKVENFIQREPNPGQESAQRTEAFTGYDDENIYVVMLAFDDNPELIRGNLSARENILADDWMGFMVDTFNNQRSAFAFSSNARGIQLDARWTEGSSRRAGFDPTFDAVWFNESQLTERGYMLSLIHI